MADSMRGADSTQDTVSDTAAAAQKTDSCAAVQGQGGRQHQGYKVPGTL